MVTPVSPAAVVLGKLLPYLVLGLVLLAAILGARAPPGYSARMPWRARLTRFLDGPGGGREVLRIATPLMLTQASYTLQVFVDRIFLTWYSTDAMAGAVTGYFSTIALIGLFSAVGEYATAFVAQYLGAGRRERIGPAVWQGIYFALASGLLVAALAPLAGTLFAAAGHPAALRAAEVSFARILMHGA